MEERLRSHYESLSRVIRFTRTADAKAGPILALQVAFLGALATRSGELYAIIVCGPWEVERMLMVGVTTAYGSLLIMVIWLAARVYLPINERTGESLIFFEDIAAMDFQAFQSQARNMSIDLIERQLIDQVYRVSLVASAKMRRVRQAIWLTLPSIGAWLTLLVWSHV